MIFRNYIVIVCFLSLHLCSIPVIAQWQVDASHCIMENELMRQEIFYGSGKIVVSSIFDKEKGVELIDKRNDSIPYFEIVMNGALVSSNDAIWKFQKYSTRKLINGGTELVLVWNARGINKGLVVTLYRQWFPNSTLIRERLALTTSGKSMTLNKWKGRLHLNFPAYAIKSFSVNSKKQVNVTETRIASFAEELLTNIDVNATYDDRKYDGTRSFNLAHCHMFHPLINNIVLSENEHKLLKGPMAVLHNGQHQFFFSYEHASQDKAWSDEKPLVTNTAGLINDQQQGVDGISGLPFEDSSLHFIGINFLKDKNLIRYHQSILRGGYFEGEFFSKEKPYQTVWSALGFSKDENEMKTLVHNYLWSQITEHPASRKPHYYYNTWGMQRDNLNTGGLYNIFTEERILQEINYAAQLGVNLFVLDDGWEEKMGEWVPNSHRLPRGIKPLIDAMHKHQMVPGIWLSPMGIDSTTMRYKQLQHLVIRDVNGVPIKAQWDHPAFDFVSSFKDSLVADCKKLMDVGIRFFKWDAINTFNSGLAGLHHGDEKHSKEEVRDRYAYLLPFYVTDAMRELREYQPDVVVEIDLTEKERCMTGLMPLQEGKFFWMNNGASGYNDYGYHRSKSMRTVINLFAGIIPTELFTQAVYPHNMYPFFAQRYNVNSTLIGGRGFWGNLALMDSIQRQRVGRTISLSKKILPYFAHLPLQVHGNAGSSPEWYLHVDAASAAGQLIAFSSIALETNISLPMNRVNSLAILRHAYSWKKDSLQLPLQFVKPDDSREVFMLPNDGTGIGIETSSGWLEDVQLNTINRNLSISAGADGDLLIRFPVSIGLIYGQSKKELQPLRREGAYNYFQVKIKAKETVYLMWHDGNSFN